MTIESVMEFKELNIYIYNTAIIKQDLPLLESYSTCICRALKTIGARTYRQGSNHSQSIVDLSHIYPFYCSSIEIFALSVKNFDVLPFSICPLNRVINDDIILFL